MAAELTPVLRAEYSGLHSALTGQASLSFAAQQAKSNLGPEEGARVSCIAACTAPENSYPSSACLYMLNPRSGVLACDVLPLPDFEATSSRRMTDMPTAHLRAQPCSRTWLSSSGRHAVSESATEGVSVLSLEDLINHRKMTLSLQALQGWALGQAWVSDSGKAVLVQSTQADQQQFCLWTSHEGDPSSSLPKQPISYWKKLPPFSQNRAESVSSELETARQGSYRGSSAGERPNYQSQPTRTAIDSDMHGSTSIGTAPSQKNQAKSRPAGKASKASLVVAAGVVSSPSGLCCCIALAEPDAWQQEKAYVQTLIQPLRADSAVESATWQETVLPFASQDGATLELTQQLLHTMDSFEELDLTQGGMEAGQPGQSWAASILLSWQPEGGVRGSSSTLLATAVSSGRSRTWLALFEAHASMPAAFVWKVPWLSQDPLRGAGPPSSRGSTSIVSLSWQPDGLALAVMDCLGRLSFYNTQGSVVQLITPSAYPGAKPREQRLACKILDVHRWNPRITAAPVMCMYVSADRSAARLAILLGSQLTILSVRSTEGIVSHSSAGTVPTSTVSATAAGQGDYADITSTIQLSSPSEAQEANVKRKRSRRLRVLVACMGPPAVLPDIQRHAETGAPLQAQRQHSLPETSPGKPLTEYGPFTLPSAIKTRSSNMLRGSTSPQLHLPALPQKSPQARDERRISFAKMHESRLPEQGKADHYPVSPHPARLQPEGAAQLGQPGRSASPRLLHMPKKSILRPRGNKAQDFKQGVNRSSSTPPAMSAAVPGDNTYGSHSTATSADSSGASFAGMYEKDPASLRAEMQGHGLHGNRTAALQAKGSTDNTRHEPTQDTPAAPKTPTALQAKLQRLKAKWSTLAERSPPFSDSRDALKPSRAVRHGSTESSIAVSVHASAPFTIVELEREDSAGIETLPDVSRVSAVQSQAAAAAAAAAEVEADTSNYYGVANASSTHAVIMHDSAEGEPGRSAWEEALGLPAGVDLWGPTVLELPDTDCTTGLSGSITHDQGSSASHTGDRRIYLTAPRPVAEAVEAVSFEDSSQLTSPTTATTGILDMRSPTSPADTDSIPQVQGKSSTEDYTSTLTSPTLAPSTITLEPALASAAESPRRPAVGADPEEPRGASVPICKPDRIQDTDRAVPDEAHERRTLDQQLSTERTSMNEGAPGDCHPQAVGQLHIISAASMPGRKHARAAQGAGQEADNAQPAASTSGVDLFGTSSICDKIVASSSMEQEATAERESKGSEPAEVACTFSEPAALDRGEPTFEDTLRSQGTKSTSRWGAQLLLLRKQAPSRQQAHASGSPQRSSCPFGIFSCPLKTKPDQATGYKEGPLPVPSDMQCENTLSEPKQAANSGCGPGPLEKGMHEVELGGYYLTTPDPLRTDPGFALRRRTSSEQSMQSAAHHKQHARDPLNFDPVHYVSSPAWRMKTQTALVKLQPNREPAPASASEELCVCRAGSLPASIRQSQKPSCQFRNQEHRGQESEAQEDSWPNRRSRGGRDTAKGRESGSLKEVLPSSARLQDGARKEGSSRHRVKVKRSRGGGETVHVCTHGATKPLADRSSSTLSEASVPDSLIPALRSQSTARLLLPGLATGNLLRPATPVRSDGIRLVDTDCKWGLNRAGRPPDEFWERSVCNPIRKTHAQDHEIRLLRVELGMPQQRSLLRGTAGKALSRQSQALSPACRVESTSGTGGQPRSSDKNVLKELQEIAAALKEIKAGGATCPNNPEGCLDGAVSKTETGIAGDGAADARQRPASSGAALLRLARKQRSPKSSSPPVSKRVSETGAADDRSAAKGINEPYMGTAAQVQRTLDSSLTAQHGSDASSHDGVGQSPGHHGQGVLPSPLPRAGVDAAVQAVPVLRRVPVQAVRLSPAPPDHQVAYSSTQQTGTAPTQLELQALQKLRENLSAGPGKPLRAFASVRDVFMETPEGALAMCVSPSAGAEPSRCSTPNGQRAIHPSSPEGASWGSRHAQHIGSKLTSMAAGKGKKDAHKAAGSRDKELKLMAAQVQNLMASLHDIETLATAVKADAAASCKMVKSLQKEQRPLVKEKA